MCPSELSADATSRVSREKIVLSWSGGKDSALALHALRQEGRYEVVALLSTVSQEFDRISHHGVRGELLARQAEAVGLPLHRVDLPTGHAGPCTNSQYDEVMREAMSSYPAAGVRRVAFGDLFLEDIRQYRESRLAELDMQGVFPLWGTPTDELARRFVALGFKAYLSCVEDAKLGERFAGRLLDAQLLADLPEAVDPCGERGEYHSFVYDGPIFQKPVPVRLGEIVRRDVRWFADLLPADQPSAAEPASS